MIFTEDTRITTRNNSAVHYGGAIYHQDSITTAQCDFRKSTHVTSVQVLSLSYCFLQLSEGNEFGRIYSYTDAAQEDGSFLYGGLLDKCRSKNYNNPSVILYDWFEYYILDELVVSPNTTSRPIASEVYQLHFCYSRLEYNSSTRHSSVAVFRGQRFSVFLLAIGQGELPISTPVTAITMLKIPQNTQTLRRECSELTYNLYSVESSEELVLYTDGPCRERGLSGVLINVTLLSCPNGFTQAGEVCLCEERLRVYDVSCSIDESILITKNSGSNFWMGVALHENGSYRGLILYQACPTEYCKSEAVNISLTDLDSQCEPYRSGVMCGACADNYSLLLGSSQCEICSNNHLALLIPFAAAGIVLIAFLTSLKLTVATGTLNSLIFYANIVQVNKSLFLPHSRVNILTVFIAWLNLDFGFETCFYNGMTSYAQTWLQFVFPLYNWILISIVILTSRYSMFISKHLRSNPIAVLATLLPSHYH